MTEKTNDKKSWQNELRRVEKPNIEKIVTWYEQGVNSRHSLKDLTKPQRDYYKNLTTYIFKNCKNKEFLNNVMIFINKFYGMEDYEDYILLPLLSLLKPDDGCDKIDLSVDDLYKYLSIFSPLDNCKALFKQILLSNVLNTGKYEYLLNIREEIDEEEIEQNIYSNVLFNKIVLSVYQEYYTNFEPDIIFQTKEKFWKTYLQIVADFPFRKVGGSSPIEVSKDVYQVLSEFIEKQSDDYDKIKLVEAFLNASIMAKSKLWNPKLNIETQFYDFLDFNLYNGERVFYSYKFRNDLNRKIGSENLEDNELAAIDKCLNDKSEPFSTFIYFLNSSKGKSKKKVLEDFKDTVCPEIKYPTNETTPTSTNPYNAAAISAIGAVTNTVSSAAQATASAARDLLSPNNTFLDSEEYKKETLPELITFLKLNSVFLENKSVDEIIKFVEEFGPDKVKTLINKQRDNKLLKAVIRTVFELNSNSIKKGCDITYEIIDNYIDNYMKREQGCQFSEEDNNYRKDTNNFQADTIKDTLSYFLYYFRGTDNNLNLIQSVLFSIFRNYRYTPNRCRLAMAKDILRYISKCNDDVKTNLINILTNIFKIHIYVITGTETTGKFTFEVYGKKEYNNGEIYLSLNKDSIGSVGLSLKGQPPAWINNTIQLLVTKPYDDYFTTNEDTKKRMAFAATEFTSGKIPEQPPNDNNI